MTVPKKGIGGDLLMSSDIEAISNTSSGVLTVEDNAFMGRNSFDNVINDRDVVIQAGSKGRLILADYIKEWAAVVYSILKLDKPDLDKRDAISIQFDMPVTGIATGYFITQVNQYLTDENSTYRITDASCRHEPHPMGEGRWGVNVYLDIKLRSVEIVDLMR